MCHPSQHWGTMDCGSQKFEEAEKTRQRTIAWWCVKLNRCFKRQNDTYFTQYFPPSVTVLHKGILRIFSRKLLIYEDQLTTWMFTPESYNMKVRSLNNFFSPKRENPGSQPEFRALVSEEMPFSNKLKTSETAPLRLIIVILKVWFFSGQHN